MYKSFKINGQPNRTSQSNILNLPILSTLLLILFSVALSACEGSKKLSNNPTTPPTTSPPPSEIESSSYAITNLRAIPGITNITLTWDNPAANISMINISYVPTAGGDSTIQSLTEYQGNSIIVSNQKNVTAVVTRLTDGTQYNFTVSAILGGADAAKNTAGVNVNRTIGANFDNDAEPDSIDADDDNDGVIDIDSDMDGTGDNVDTDDDGDGVNDDVDAFPLDNSRSSFRVGNLRAIPGVTNIILTWDNPAANISMITISYIATSGGANRVTQTLTTYQGASIIGNNQAAASAAINALTDRTEYNFTVTPILGGTDAAKNTAGVSAIRTIGANFDNDAEPDSIDTDDDNDGVDDGADTFPMDSAETTDTDGDGTGDNADTDDDGDGVDDGADAFPKNSAETTDTDGDGIGNNSDAFPNDSAESADTDMDGTGDNADVDDDGDGLIEIHNATQLDQVRYSLAGHSFNGDVTGCGVVSGIRRCLGYELAAPIDLSAIDNWQPLGFCTDDGCSMDFREPFTATFDGNGHIINGLTINSTDDSRRAIALFGIIEGADLRNIHLRNANVNVNHTANAAMLVGYMWSGSTLSNSSGQGSVIAITDNTGGLVGSTTTSNDISYSYVFDSVVMGNGARVGGLVGSLQSGISSSYVSNTTVSGVEQVGGLVGASQNDDISASYVIDSFINGSANFVGGLVGNIQDTHLSASYVSNTSISGGDFVGGLAGYFSVPVGGNYKVTASYVLATSVNGTNYIGGLVGFIFINTALGSTITINPTYVAQVELRATDSNIGGLAGNAPAGLIIAASYWQGAIFINGMQNNSASVAAGIEQTRSQLQLSAFTGNYADWGGFWCDPDSGEFTDDSSLPFATNTNRAWVLPPLAVSTSFPAAPHISRYPTLSCTPGGAAAQDAQRLGL